MAFCVRPRESIAHGLRRLAKKQLSSASDRLSGAQRPRESHVHAARKAVKKVRAIIHLVKRDHGSGLSKSRKRLRDANRVLSRSRDADAMSQIFTTLLDRQPGVLSEHTRARLRRQLADNRDAMARAAARHGTWKQVAAELRAIGKSVKRWSQSHDGFGGFVPGLRATHKRGREAMALAIERREAEDFHEWRKQIKALWYELRLIEHADAAIGRDVEALGRAQTALGDDHNVAVLAAFLAASKAAADAGDELRQFLQGCDDYQQELRRAAIAGARAIYSRPTGDFVREVKRAWRHRSRADQGKRGAGSATRAQRS
jgi:CHAD domain-containing protein